MTAHLLLFSCRFCLCAGKAQAAQLAREQCDKRMVFCVPQGDYVVLAAEPVCISGVDVAAPQQVRRSQQEPLEAFFAHFERQFTPAEVLKGRWKHACAQRYLYPAAGTLESCKLQATNNKLHTAGAWDAYSSLSATLCSGRQSGLRVPMTTAERQPSDSTGASRR